MDRGDQSPEAACRGGAHPPSIVDADRRLGAGDPRRPVNSHRGRPRASGPDEGPDAAHASRPRRKAVEEPFRRFGMTFRIELARGWHRLAQPESRSRGEVPGDVPAVSPGPFVATPPGLSQPGPPAGLS